MVNEGLGEEVVGRILEPLPNGMFRVTLDTGHEVVAHVSGEMRMHSVRLLPGERVSVDVSLYDKSRGRISAKVG